MDYLMFRSHYLLIRILLTVVIIISSSLYHVAFSNEFAQRLLHLKFQQIPNQGGLANNRINNIIKDGDGYLWFATENGVTRYDGDEVKNYFYDPLDAKSLYGNFVVSFLMDQQNRLWVGTNIGLMWYNKNCDQFERISLDVPGETRQYIFDLEQLPDRTIIALTSSKVLYVEPQSGTLKEYFSVNDVRELDPRDEFSQLCYIPASGQLLISSQSKFILCHFPEKDFVLLKNPCGAVRNIYNSHDSVLWISSMNGLFRMNPESHKIAMFNPGEKKNQHYFSQHIRDVLMDEEDNLWVATDQNGIVCYETATGKCWPFYHKKFDNQSLNNNLIRKIFLDNQGVLWVGTQYKGINYALLNNPKEFKIYQNRPDEYNSLSSNVVSAVLKDKQGYLWVGTDGDGLNIISPESGLITKTGYDGSKPVTITTNAVLAIYQDSRDNVWVSGYNGTLCLYNSQTHTWSEIRYKCSQPDCNGLHDFRQFLEDSKHRMWIATNGHGIFRYDYGSGQFREYTSHNGSIIDNHVISLCENDDGRLWVGTYNGACLFDPESSKSLFYNYSEYTESGLSNNWIYSICRNRENKIWLGTAYGLNRYDADKKLFSHFYTSDGLPGNVIDGILEDEEGNLWISTNNGISKRDAHTGQFINYSMADGLPGNEFIHGSFYRSREGELYFGSNYGLVSFYPSRIRPDTNVSSVIIRDVLVFFKSIFKEKECGTGQDNETRKKIVLSHKQSTLTFSYTALNFINARDNNFSYILEGFEKDWNEVGNRREATYVNLDPGHYVFRVTGCNNDGICDRRGDSIDVVILHPWWATWYSRMLLMVILLVTAVGMYYRRISRIMKQKMMLESIVHQRTAELQEKNEQLDEMNKMNERIFSIIAHDLKSPFSSVMGFTELLAKETNVSGNDIQNKFISYILVSLRRINVLMENLLLWSSNQLKNFRINPVKYSLNDQIRNNIELFQDMLRQKNLSLRFNPERVCHVYADYQMIDAVIRNLVSNAIKFSNPDGEIEISLTSDGTEVSCSVRDYGLGMDEEEKSLIFSLDSRKVKNGTKGEQGSGLGLVICHDFITRNRGRIGLESESGKGSTFYFSIPVSV
jgi:ligand-binding sensor domain-containing protein/signal transduction histidine kinase